jgi:hypothetical protein
VTYLFLYCSASGILCDLSAGPIISCTTLKSFVKVMIDIKIQVAWNGICIRFASEGALGMLRQLLTSRCLTLLKLLLSGFCDFTSHISVFRLIQSRHFFKILYWTS